MARELSHNPELLIAAQPTRGVDIGAIEIIHNEILKLRENKKSVLLVSSDLDEVMKLSDRIIGMFKGKTVATIDRDHFDEKKIGSLMGGLIS